jgi:hypothetical protein
MSRVRASARGVGISIVVPDSWYEFDIHPDTRDANIRRIVAARIRDFPELADYRSDLTTLLRRMSQEAWDSGAVYFGCMAENFEDLPLTASVTVSIVAAASPQGGALNTEPAAIASALQPKQASGPDDTWRTVKLVGIPEVGHAARTMGIEDIRSPGDDRAIRVALMQTFVPAPRPAPDRADGDAPRVAIISGSSPVLDLADSFFDVFDAITSTFRFLKGR